MSAKTQITISGVLADLANGLTRTPKSKNYDSTKGSIQEKYNLSGVEVKMLFTDPNLKNKKVHVVSEVSFVLINDLAATPVAKIGAEEIVETNVVAETVVEDVVAGEVVTEEKGW